MHLNRVFARPIWKRALLLLLPTGLAFADAIPACPSTTFNVYISKYESGCAVGSLIFSNFSMASYTVPPAGKVGAPTAITSDMIEVSGTNKDGYVGLMFNASWDAVGVQEQITTFSFSVTAMPGVSILGARATIAGKTAGPGIKQASFKDTLCPGGTFNKDGACVADGKFIPVVEPFPTEDKMSKTEMFSSPVTTVSANPRARVLSFDPKGSASMAQVTSEFLVTPEPSSFSLLLIGLGGIAIGIAGRIRLRRPSRHLRTMVKDFS
jgi:PEP-CTERM motif